MLVRTRDGMNMTIEELYEEIGGDFATAVMRLQNEALVARFIVKFTSDQSCPGVIEAWKRGDDTATFEAAHMAKGVCANLALTNLTTLASEITEALRPGNEELRASVDVDALVAQLDEAYGNTIQAINAFAEAN